jgi:hypothetical protein
MADMEIGYFGDARLKKMVPWSCGAWASDRRCRYESSQMIERSR